MRNKRRSFPCQSVLKNISRRLKIQELKGSQSTLQEGVEDFFKVAPAGDFAGVEYDYTEDPALVHESVRTGAIAAALVQRSAVRLHGTTTIALRSCSAEDLYALALDLLLLI